MEFTSVNCIHVFDANSGYGAWHFLCQFIVSLLEISVGDQMQEEKSNTSPLYLEDTYPPGRIVCFNRKDVSVL
jgi:hypothetical protein